MKHFYQDIEGWSNFLGLTRLLVSTLPTSGATWVEVGTWKGRSAAFTGVEMLNQDKHGQLHLVDTWQGSDEPLHHQDQHVQAGTLFEHCKQNLEWIEGLIIWHRKTSLDASKEFPDQSCDVVFLDAAHDRANVLADLVAWGPKVKPSGYMAGDDLSWNGVSDAVSEYFAGNPLWELAIYVGPEQYPVWLAYRVG